MVRSRIRGGLGTGAGTVSRVRLFIANFPSEAEARTVAAALVKAHLAAAVNIVPAVHSVYRWKDEICEASESQLVAKTTDARVVEVTAFIRDNHSYEQPAILCLTVDDGDSGYLAWIAETADGEGGQDPR